MQSGCIWAKFVVVIFGQKYLYLDKVVIFWIKLLYSGRMVVFGQNGCFPESGIIWAKVVVFRRKLLYSGKVVVFVQKKLQLGKRGFIRAKMVVFGQSDCIRAKWLY